ncbi:penicillin-binding protein, partial [Pelobium sp.]|nr:penicillin-binding protein [Pelobium sp.]
KSKYNLNVKINSYGFKGLGTVYFKDISVLPEKRDSLAKIDNLEVGIKLLPLIFGHVKISELGIQNALISLSKKDSISNYDFLFKKNEKDSTQTNSKVDLSELANKLLKQALDKIPDDMEVHNFMVKFDEDTTHLSILTESATIHHNDVNSTLKVNGNEATWHVVGQAEPSEQKLDLKLFADHKKVEFPYLEKKDLVTLNMIEDLVEKIQSKIEF